MTKPLSREFLINRKVCCSHKCVNCPYDPRHTKGSTKINFKAES
jgi:hypothetical protein